jgi:hypothetical protein
MVAASDILPGKTTAHQHAKMAKPGSADPRKDH